MGKTLTVSEAAPLLGLSTRAVVKRIEAGKLPGARKIRGQWLVPTSAHSRLWDVPAPAPAAGLPDVGDVAPPKRDEAIRRLGLLAECESFVGTYRRAGGKRTDAIVAFCHEKKIAVSTLRRWMRRKREEGVLGLVDTRGGRRVAEDCITPEAFDHFKSLYLDPKRPSMKECWIVLRYINKTEGRNWRIPSYPTMARYVKEHIPYAALVLHREGLRAYESKCSPYIQLDPESVAPGEVWIGDHHEFNCFVRHQGKWVRPWITAWQDWRSRMIVGRCISLAPNQTTILRATGMAIQEYGPPDGVTVDNGRDYDSQMWTGQTKADRKARKVLRAGYLEEPFVGGLYEMLGIAVTFTIPYRPKSKRIERWFATLDDQFTRTMPTYTGKDTKRKPEGLVAYLASDEAIDRADDLTSFAAKVDQYIGTFNNTVHTGAGMEGRTPAEVFATRESRRVPLTDSLELLLRVWSGPITVGKNGVRLNGVYYGQTDTLLLERQGRQVRASYDPDDVRSIHVYDMDMRFVTRAEANVQLAYGGKVPEEALRQGMREQARAKKHVKGHKDAALTANMDIGVVAQRALAAQTKPVTAKLKKVLARPVATVMDGQVAAVTAAEQRATRKRPKLRLFDKYLDGA